MAALFFARAALPGACREPPRRQPQSKRIAQLRAALRLLEPLLDADYDAARRSALPDGAG